MSTKISPWIYRLQMEKFMILAILLLALAVFLGIMLWQMGAHSAIGGFMSQHLGGYLGGFLGGEDRVGGGCGCTGGDDGISGNYTVSESFGGDYDGGDERVFGTAAAKGNVKTVSGHGKISNESYDNLVINGDFSLDAVKAKNLTINGYVRGNGIEVSDKAEVSGSAIFRDSKIGKLSVLNTLVPGQKPSVTLVSTPIKNVEIKDPSGKESDFVRNSEPRPAPAGEKRPPKKEKPAV